MPSGLTRRALPSLALAHWLCSGSIGSGSGSGSGSAALTLALRSLARCPDFAGTTGSGSGSASDCASASDASLPQLTDTHRTHPLTHPPTQSLAHIALARSLTRSDARTQHFLSHILITLPQLPPLPPPHLPDRCPVIPLGATARPNTITPFPPPITSPHCHTRPDLTRPDLTRLPT